MIQNYLKIAARNLAKDKIFTIINIIGLALGISSFLLIFRFISFEESYETFIPDYENIYRVQLSQYQNGEVIISSAENYPGVGPALMNEFEEVQSYARLYNLGYKNNVVIAYDDAPNGRIQFKHRKFLYADSSFLPMMGYEFIFGDPVSALAEPNSAVISETYARNYFGNEGAVGKMLHLQDDDFNNELVKVTGVDTDLPQNTHLKFDILFSYKTLFSRWEGAIARYDQSWQRKDMYTYIKVRPGTDKDVLQSKFPAIVGKYLPGLAERNRKDILQLQPLASIHLTSKLAEEQEANGDFRVVNFLKIIAAFVLIIAWVNYINMSTARSMERAAEVGLRKTMGAHKVQLIGQFLMEAALVNFFSLLIAMVIIALMLPQFSQLTEVNLSISSFLTTSFISIGLIIWLLGSLLSGFYPAFILSGFRPVKALKGKLRNQGAGSILRKSLVIFQFAASVTLICGTLIIYKQLNFMKSQDLGMSIDQVLVIERPGVAPREREKFAANIDFFRNEIAKIPAVKSISTSITIPGKKREYKVEVRPYGTPIEQNAVLRFNSMDYNFIPTFEMQLLAGRAFSPDFINDQDTSVIVTLSASRMLGFKNPEDAIGKTLVVDAFQWNPIIAGVVNDYHQEALHKPLDPMIFYCTLYGGEFYSLKIDPSNFQTTLGQVKTAWEAAFPGNPLDYFFLDDYFNRQYNTEEKFGKIFTLFAGLAIVVGCFGLFALAAFTAQQRTKEIGVRKVLGSSTSSILILLNRDFILLVILANLIAWPLSWYFMNRWLQTFATRINLGPGIFLMSGLVVLVLAIIVVSFQTFRAANASPVESLRYE